MGGIVSLAGMGLHAVTDFNLHIPANMVLFRRRSVPDPGHGLLSEDLRSPLKKKVLPLVGLAALVLLQAAVAWNARLCWRVRAVVTDPDAKIRLLERADAVFPWNDAASFELGKVYFERGVEVLGRSGRARYAFPPVRRSRSFARFASIPPRPRPTSSWPRRSST